MDREFLRKLADTVSANRIRLTVKYLCKRYDDYSSYSDIRKREHLDVIMRDIEQVHRTEDDFRLIFAIRTLFTLDSHQHILKSKRETIHKYLDEVEANSRRLTGMEFLLFDLNPDEMQMPNILWLDAAVEFIMKKQPAQEESPIESQHRGFLTPLLLLGAPNNESVAYFTERLSPFRSMRNHRLSLHRAQEFAVILYGNSDAFCAVTNYLKDNVELILEDHNEGNRPSKEYSIQEKLLLALIKQFNGFNDGYLKAYVVNGGVTITQKTGHIWDYELFRVIMDVMRALKDIEESESVENEQKADKNEGVATVVDNNAEDELKQQGPNPGKRPKFDRGKTMPKLED